MKQQFSSKNLSALLCVSFITLSSTVFSQNNSSVSVATASNSLEPIIVTATRSATKAEDVLADFVYIGPEEIAQAAQTSLTDLLQQQRGIQVSSYGGNGNLSSVNLRGTSNAQSLLLIDGVRIDNSASGGGILNSIPLSLIDHIEIVFGAQGTMYGSNAIGGVIQVFTKTGGGPTQFTASSGYGTYGTSMNNASLAGSIDDVNKTKYSIGLSQENSSGFNTLATNNNCSPSKQNSCVYATNATGYTRLGATGQISQEWSKGQQLGVSIFASSNKNQYPGSTIDSLDPNLPYGGPYNPLVGQQFNKFFTATGFTKNQITEIWQSVLQISAVSNSQQSIWPPIGVTSANDKIDMPEYDYLWQNNILIGEDRLQLLAEHRSQYVYVTNTPALTGCVDNCLVNQSRTTDSIAGSYELKRGNNLATLSLRNDSISGFNSKVTGGAAYGYFFTKEWRASVNYSTGYRVPTFNDMYSPGTANPALTPESSHSIEAGVNYEGRSTTGRLSIYQNNISNYIEPYYTAGSNLNGYPINIGLAKIQGISAGAQTYIGNFLLRGSVDHLNAIDENSGSFLPRRARNTANLAADYKQGKINLGANLTYSGQTNEYSIKYAPDYTVIGTNVQTNNPYTLLSLYSSYEFEPHWKVFARWNNVTNSHYQTIYGYNNMGSNIFAGVSYSYR
ncbi:TonB-dependent siderophore receptor [Polynucleobacter sp. UB-Siik-W21]|uniref:TonB-dependent receptor plug domain-containing protein n=1 Tax=Polynucleobacter sp. UB-Siik-W21 TaxID=1855646 RepID=UPI001BFE4A86|nr:TonB-dependent receptor [Polynucleobacter sp. UB-Siik-W21]QWD70982.1 TonB-dependent receptor [Polynucleobacter sp. UB-Siik-W21]